jgi:hypothetical protein
VRFIALGCLLLLSLPAGEAVADTIERRGAEPPLEGEVTSIDDGGVRIRSETGATHFVCWDHVRDVRTTRVDPALERYLAIAEDLWRARSRVERGDAALAEDLLGRLFEQYRGQTHEAALVAAEGLLRCRLARGTNDAAVIPALEVVRMRRGGIVCDSYRSLPPVIDEATWLCPQLPPFWMQSRTLAKLQRDLAEYDAGDDAVVAALARQYRTAALQHLALAGEVGVETSQKPESSAVDQDGVRWLGILNGAWGDDAAAREAARQRLAQMAVDAPAWQEAWTRFALGASLLGERGIGRRQRGLVNLIHVPARFASTQPYLAGLALAWVAEAARQDGETETATLMLAELARRFPNHPVRSTDDAVQLPKTKDAP